jgi:pyruvate dehydrogenase E1 component
MRNEGRPTVILAKTIKGFGMGEAGEGKMTAHQIKKLGGDDLKAFRDRFNIPVSDADIDEVPYYKPPEDSEEIRYMHERRKELGGYLPARYPEAPKLKAPALEDFQQQLDGTGEREISTTMALVRMLTRLVKDKTIGKNIVPIVPDEARTFGMEGMFRQIAIYSSVGQLYTPQDSEQLMYYREDKKGQILEEGINEAGAFCSWIAAATAYANHGVPMIPFYIYYSMFGFQRIGDFAWAAGDMQARGFLIGGTAGRTTLAGEGLQHQDGHSLLQASTIPNCVSYDPAYAFELAVVVQDGLRRMYEEQENVFYYITCMNENYVHPAMPDGARDGIIKGMYKLHAANANRKDKGKDNKLRVQLLGSGTILREVEAAAEYLRENCDVDADVWSVTSYSELRREGIACERWNTRHPLEVQRTPYVSECFEGFAGPVIAASDYMRIVPEQIREWVPGAFRVLGTDGFGRSDSRRALREHFEVNRDNIVLATLKALADEGALKPVRVAKELVTLGLDPDKPNPVDV